MNNRDLGQLWCGAPAVDGQGQSTPHADVVKRLALMVRRYHPATVPVTGLYCDFVAESLLQLVDSGGREAAKFNRGPVGANCLDPHGLLIGEYPGKAVEVRQALMEVVRVALTLDRLAGVVGYESERTGAENVLLVPVRVLVEDRLFVDPGVGIGQCRQKCVGGEL